jgi:cyanophycin synthetase
VKILELRALRGPNVWSRFATIYMRLDLEDFAERPTNTLAGFTDLLMKLLPSIYEHRCGLGRVGGFESRLREGTYLGHVIEHVAIELQCLAGMEVGFGKTRETSAPGVYHVVYRYRDERAGIEAGRQAFGIVEALAQGQCLDIDPILQRLREIREESMLGASTASIVEEAVARDIPFIRLNEASLVQLGWGAEQRRIQATLTGRTSALGVEIADDKSLTKRLLRRAGVPVPEGSVVDSPQEAAAAAKELGFPVTVKPLIGNHGRGISVRVAGVEDVGPAFESARAVCSRVLVEQFLDGLDFRILVIGHRMVAASLRTPAHVVGDGKHTVGELIEEVNRSELRGFGHENVLTYITPDAMTERLLHEARLDLESVPEQGRIVRLKSTANLSMGGTARDVTDTVHSANRFMAERISRVIDLDIMGIDIIAPTLETPILESGGGVVEVNAAPGFRMHERGPRVPDASLASEGEAQAGRHPRHRLAFRPRRAREDPARGRYRDQRENDNGPFDLPSSPNGRRQSRLDHDGRDSDRDPHRHARRLRGTGGWWSRPPRPYRRRGGARSRAGRDPAQRPLLRPCRRGGGPQRRRGPSGDRAHR